MTVRPNFERKPPDDCQRPPPRAASFTRMPICGRTPTFSAYSRISASSVYFSTTGMMLPADLLGQHRHLDELGVLEAVADDRRVVVGHRDDGEQLRLRAGLEAEPVRAAEVEHFLDDLALLVHLDRIDAAVLALVLVLGDRALERARGCRPSRCLRMSVKRTRIGRPMPRSCRRSTSCFRSIARSGSLVGCTCTWPFDPMENSLCPSGRPRRVRTRRTRSRDRPGATRALHGWSCSQRPMIRHRAHVFLGGARKSRVASLPAAAARQRAVGAVGASAWEVSARRHRCERGTTAWRVCVESRHDAPRASIVTTT